MSLSVLSIVFVGGFLLSALVRWDERRQRRWDRAKAWQEGYRQGIQDEITSAETNYEYGPNRENPYIPAMRWWERLRYNRAGKKRYNQMKKYID